MAFQSHRDSYFQLNCENKMLRKLLTVTSFRCIWLVVIMAVLAAAQPPYESRPLVLDTDGRPLQRGVEYYILPEDEANGTHGGAGGGLTLVDRNNSCPLFVGQENEVDSQGFPVKFTPFFDGETIVRESSDFSIAFSSVGTICVQSTAWNVGEQDPETGRRLIVTGGEGDYFRIEKNGSSYHLAYCPLDACPNCRQWCGDAGVLIENQKRLLALDGSSLNVVFKRA